MRYRNQITRAFRTCVNFGCTAMVLLGCLFAHGAAAQTVPEQAQRVLREHRLFPKDPMAGSRFGYSAGISGNTMVIGAFVADGATPGSGAAYVFERKNDHWVQSAKIFANDGAEGDGFGSSAAIDGDTIIVGSPFSTVGTMPGAGVAYIFHREKNAWVQQAKLEPPVPAFFGGFGDDLGVSISGDTAAVADGAAFQPPSTFGAISIFARKGSRWTQSARVRVANEPSFATSVSLNRDTLVVGALNGNAPGAEFAGAAYVFQRKQNRWVQQARLTASDASPSGGLGFSAAVSGDLIAIGAINAQVNGHTPGAIYVFGRDNDNWKQQAKLAASDGMDFDLLGFRVAISGSTVLGGAENRSLHGDVAVGAAYVFQPHDGTWMQTAELAATDGTESALFGCSTAVDGNSLVVGAGGQTTKVGQGAGEAYTYQLDGR